MDAKAARDRDADLIARAVAELVRRTEFPLAFGGLADGRSVEITAAVGTRTRLLHGLVVHPERGLGGRALIEKRPRLAVDYRTSRNITHDYDGAVLGEGISTLFAMPLVVAGSARGILYLGAWSQSPVGDLALQPALAIADATGGELRIRDEVARRVALSAPRNEIPGMDAATREELRESYAELRSITASVQDAEVRERLNRLERRLAALSAQDAGGVAVTDLTLSPRETDVLARVALGATNAEIASSLSLKEGTVKSYLQSAMTKLDASTRHSAVAKARRVGLLP